LAVRELWNKQQRWGRLARPGLAWCAREVGLDGGVTTGCLTLLWKI